MWDPLVSEDPFLLFASAWTEVAPKAICIAWANKSHMNGANDTRDAGLGVYKSPLSHPETPKVLGTSIVKAEALPRSYQAGKWKDFGPCARIPKYAGVGEESEMQLTRSRLNVAPRLGQSERDAL